MSVTAKVICTTKRVTGEGDNAQAALNFSVDYGDERNQEWAAATPSLNISMVVNGKVHERFQQGHHFTLTFEDEDSTDLRSDEQREADDAVEAEQPDQPVEVEQPADEPATTEPL